MKRFKHQQGVGMY